MHPLILQQLAAGHVNDMIAAAAGSRRARQPRRTRRSRTFRLTTQLGLPRSQADETARRVARSVGWRVEGHPTGATAGATAGIVPPQSAVVRAELIHPARPHDDRDMDLNWASDVILAVESDWGETSALVHHAAAAGWEVTYIKSSKLGVIPAQGHPSTAGSWPIVHNWLGDAWR